MQGGAAGQQSASAHQEVYVGVCIDSARQCHAVLLPSRQVDSLLADLRGITWRGVIGARDGGVQGLERCAGAL